ncbi:hypothetical protein BaRGS_00023733, partial [Batillaria attramentaria]
CSHRAPRACLLLVFATNFVRNSTRTIEDSKSLTRSRPHKPYVVRKDLPVAGDPDCLSLLAAQCGASPSKRHRDDRDRGPEER